jgi:hypothetical protein
MSPGSASLTKRQFINTQKVFLQIEVLASLKNEYKKTKNLWKKIKRINEHSRQKNGEQKLKKNWVKCLKMNEEQDAQKLQSRSLTWLKSLEVFLNVFAREEY